MFQEFVFYQKKIARHGYYCEIIADLLATVTDLLVHALARWPRLLSGSHKDLQIYAVSVDKPRLVNIWIAEYNIIIHLSLFILKLKTAMKC